MTTISNETLLYDIEWTQKELEAYQQLVSAFSTLLLIPDGGEQIATNYQFDILKYQGYAEECEEFLKKLLEIKKKRGL